MKVEYSDQAPEQLADEIEAILQRSLNNEQLNKQLVDLYIHNGDRIGLPHQCKCLANDDLKVYLRHWGWPEDLINERLYTGYVICSYEGGAGPALRASNGDWIGAVEWDLALSLRKAWFEAN